jgi:hypothetical protein
MAELEVQLEAVLIWNYNRGKRAKFSTVYDAGRAKGPVWTQWRRE